VNPELDRQPRRVWPNPVDTPLDRARKVAGMYRARLRTVDLDACNDCDATATSFGETWMLEKPDVVDPYQDWTTSEAAEQVGVSQGTIRKWACWPHPTVPDRMWLPRFGQRNGERTYLAQHVLEAAALARKGHARPPSLK
jgi:hypothetical protein